MTTFSVVASLVLIVGIFALLAYLEISLSKGRKKTRIK
ncbi:hypothetical protein GD1_124 [Paraglaciecola Antarctic GD virus 1]|nr:hypothetical protein GD1_124 [Paraglaciecola Antarctic GD virus 1]